MTRSPGVPRSPVRALRTDVCHVERGSLAQLAAVLDRFGARRVVLVRDVGAWRGLAGDERFADALAGREVTVRDVDDPRPLEERVDEVAATVRAAEADVLLAVGGGTALDTAKCARVLAAAAPEDSGPSGVRAALSGAGADAANDPARRPVLVAVPTTAGTGAETTSGAVVYVDGVKHSLDDAGVKPRFALVDPALCDGLPPAVTASTGLDALCQAGESLWAVASDEVSRGAARDALTLAVGALERAVVAPDAWARDAMSLAAYLAGTAIDRTRTTAPHALSYVPAARYGLAHGHSVALFFGEALVRLAAVGEDDCADPRGPDFVRARVGEVVAAFGADSPEDARDRFERLVAACGLRPTLRDVGAGPGDLDAFVTGVNPSRLANHPQRLDASGLRGFVGALLGA